MTFVRTRVMHAPNRDMRNRLGALLSRIAHAMRPRRAIHISPHIARDIGLSPAELERIRLELPSERLRHPML